MSYLAKVQLTQEVLMYRIFNGKSFAPLAILNVFHKIWDNNKIFV